MGICHAGDLFHPGQQFPAGVIGGVDIGALDLHVDGRGQAEVQHLAHNVGSLEIESGVGKGGRQTAAHLAHILGRRVMALAELDQDFRIHAADIVGRHQRQVVIDRHPDHVVDGMQFVGRDDLADMPFHIQHQLFRLFDPGAGGAAVMQLDDADIGSGEEIGADHREQAAGQQYQHSGRRKDEFALLQNHGQHAAIRLAQPDEAALEGAEQALAFAFLVNVLGQQEARKGRHHREGQKIRGDHRQDHGDGQRDEQEPRRPFQQHHREEDDADSQGRHCQRLDHFARAIHDRESQPLPQRLVAMDVLDGDGGIVHQQADGQRQPTQGHQVDALSRQQQTDQAGADGERNRQRHHHCAAPIAQEQQDHQRHQNGGDHCLTDHIGDGSAHEYRLVEI